MSANKDNKIIVVLGSGRTGTSLLTNILVGLGMETSKKLIPASTQNPKGFFEDKEIVEINKEILNTLRHHAYIPFDLDSLRSPSTTKFVSSLKDILIKNINTSSTIWGFKDPRTPVLLPLWNRVFNQEKITPTYVLTVRDPAKAITSMHTQYADPPLLSELAWLHRNCEALYHTGGNCFIVHYEDWFTDQAKSVALKLSTYTDLDRFQNEETKNSLKSQLRKTISPNLNRSIYNDYTICNRYVRKLYKQLQQCSGDQFDRNALMETVMECRQAMKEFSGWSDKAQSLFSAAKSANKEKTSSLPIVQKIDIKNELNHCKIKESISKKEIEKLNRNINELQKSETSITKAEQQLILVKSSASYQLGNVLVKAVTKPGKNTLLLPLYLVRIIFSKRVLKKS